jgi:hypothetical protein
MNEKYIEKRVCHEVIYEFVVLHYTMAVKIKLLMGRILSLDATQAELHK